MSKNPFPLCALDAYGVSETVTTNLINDILNWLNGVTTQWTMTTYTNVYTGPDGRFVIELLNFHYDGQPEHEIGSGCELNHCTIYLYDDHVSLHFTADTGSGTCGLTFKTANRWSEVDKGLLSYIIRRLREYQAEQRTKFPHRFDGTDQQIEFVKSISVLADGALKGNVFA